jgi:hypothetical protein
MNAASMERIALRSRDLAIAGYDRASSTLEITFRSGGVYHYRDVPEEVFRALLAAPSQGRFFHEQILDRYPHSRIS